MQTERVDSKPRVGGKQGSGQSYPLPQKIGIDFPKYMLERGIVPVNLQTTTDAVVIIGVPGVKTDTQTVRGIVKTRQKPES
jgi:hypothetical protein